MPEVDTGFSEVPVGGSVDGETRPSQRREACRIHYHCWKQIRLSIALGDLNRDDAMYPIHAHTSRRFASTPLRSATWSERAATSAALALASVAVKLLAPSESDVKVGWRPGTIHNQEVHLFVQGQMRNWFIPYKNLVPNVAENMTALALMIVFLRNP